MNCKKCSHSESRMGAGQLNQWKQVIHKPFTKWYCKLMHEVDHKGFATFCSVELKNFDPCELFKEREDG